MSDHRAVKVAFPNAPPGTCRHCGKPCGRGDRTHKACVDRHREKVNYREATLRDNGERCAGCGARKGPFHADHIIPLVDGGSHDAHNRQVLCTPCHRLKTGYEATARAAAKRGAKAKVERTRTTPKSENSVSWIRVYLGLVLIYIAAVESLGHPAIARSGGLLALLAAVVFVLGRRHLEQRTTVVLRLRDLVGRETGTSVTAPGLVKVRRWRGLTPSLFTVTYGPTFDDRDETARARLEDVVRRKVDERFVVDGWSTQTDFVTFRFRRADDVDRVEPDPEPSQDAAQAAITERLDLAIRGFIRTGDPKIQVGGWDAIGPTSVAVGYPSTFRDDSADVRLGLQEVINAKTPGRWRLDWDTGADHVVAARRPAMPKVAMHPVPDDIDDTWRLPFAVDEDGNVVAWDLKIAPHMLVAGETGGGKSVALRALVVEAALRGFEVRIADPKRVEMMGLRGWPNVAEVATDTEEMIDLVERMHARMDDRYAEIESRKVAKDSHRPVLLVVDEAHEWIERSNAYWKANREKGQTGTVHPVVEQWRSIARLGRTGRVHLLVGIQRPDASIFGGAARDNYGARVALGALSQDGAKMIFADPSVGRDVPASAKGRATVDVGDGPREVQVYFTPDPEDVQTSEGKALLETLRAAATRAASRSALDRSRLQVKQ